MLVAGHMPVALAHVEIGAVDHVIGQDGLGRAAQIDSGQTVLKVHLVGQRSRGVDQPAVKGAADQRLRGAHSEGAGGGHNQQQRWQQSQQQVAPQRGRGFGGGVEDGFGDKLGAVRRRARHPASGGVSGGASAAAPSSMASR